MPSPELCAEIAAAADHLVSAYWITEDEHTREALFWAVVELEGVVGHLTAVTAREFLDLPDAAACEASRGRPP